MGHNSGWQYVSESEGLVTIKKEEGGIVKKQYSLANLSEHLMQREAPLNMGLMDDMLVIHYRPNILESFKLNHMDQTVEKSEVHTTLVLNDNLPANTKEVMPL